MALLGKSYAHYGEEIVATESEESLRRDALQARKWAEKLLPYKKLGMRKTETIAAVYKETNGTWNRIWLQRGQKSENESIAILADSVGEDVLLSFGGDRGMGRYRVNELGAIESGGGISIAGISSPVLQEQQIFVGDLLETLTLIDEQQQAERIRHFAGRLALNAR